MEPRLEHRPSEQPRIVAIYARTAQVAPRKIEQQIERCKDYAAAKGWTVVKVYADDGQSGGALTRPGLEQFVRDAEDRKFNLLLAVDGSRVSRNTVDLQKIAEVLRFNQIALVFPE